jgi:hypothetical protein
VPFDPELLEWLTTPNTALIDASGAVRPAQHGAHHAQHDASGAVRPAQHGAPQAQHDAAGAVRPAGVFVAYGEREREPPPPPDAPATQWTSLRANVHRGIPEASHQLAAVLRTRGHVVEGAVEIAGEDHTSLKLSLVSRGIGWLINERWATA